MAERRNRKGEKKVAYGLCVLLEAERSDARELEVDSGKRRRLVVVSRQVLKCWNVLHNV